MVETTAQVLRRRHQTGETSADDGCRLALISEGGAMRGVFAGGMVSGIEAEGFTKCFDLMVGASAGAGALIYLRAGQARYGTRMFYEDLNTGAFIKPWRMLTGGPALSIDFLVDHVFNGSKRLDFDALRAPGAELHITGTDVDQVETVDFSGFQDDARTLEVMRATTRMPLVSEAPVVIGDRRFLDGALLSPLPLGLAIQHGATHVLALLTRQPYSKHIGRASFSERQLAHRFLAWRYSAKLARQIAIKRQEYGDLYAALTTSDEITASGVCVQAVAPSSDAPPVHRTTQESELLRAGAAHGETRMREYLLGDHGSAAKASVSTDCTSERDAIA